MYFTNYLNYSLQNKDFSLDNQASNLANAGGPKEILLKLNVLFIVNFFLEILPDIWTSLDETFAGLGKFFYGFAPFSGSYFEDWNCTTIYYQKGYKVLGLGIIVYSGVILYIWYRMQIWSVTSTGERRN